MSDSLLSTSLALSSLIVLSLRSWKTFLLVPSALPTPGIPGTVTEARFLNYPDYLFFFPSSPFLFSSFSSSSSSSNAILMSCYQSGWDLFFIGDDFFLPARGLGKTPGDARYFDETGEALRSSLLFSVLIL